jgi:hypothetical protein
MAAKRQFFQVLGATACTTIAAWVAGGALTLTSVDGRSVRLGILPAPSWLVVGLVVAVAAALLVRARSWRFAPVLTVSLLLLLPWLPTRVPLAFYVWTGPARTWLWALLAITLTAPLCWELLPGSVWAVAREPRRAPWLAALIAAFAYLVGAYRVFPHLPAGDEPHYLVITQSLLRDHDLKIENNHRQGDYHAYFPGELKPDYLRRGTDEEIYSIHAPGLPALVAPMFAVFGYPGVLALLALVSGCATGLAWTATWRVTSDLASSWFGWATVALTAPFFFQSFVVYPDAPAAAIVMFGVVTLFDGPEASLARLGALGTGLALLPWLHTRFAILAATLAAVTLARQWAAPDRVRRAVALGSIPLISATCWFVFFHVIYGTPDPRAPYGTLSQNAVANLPRGIVGLIVDQQFGLLPNAPVYLCAALGCLLLARRATRLAVELTVLVVPYGLAVAGYQMWWAGYSSPARFIVPILLPLAIPSGLWFQASRGRSIRMLGFGALAVSMLITVTIASVDRGALLYNVRDGASRLFLWLSPLVDVTTGLPSLFQTGPRMALVHAGIWLAAAAVTASIGAVVASRGASTVTVGVSMSFGAAASAMLALTMVWRDNGAAPVTATTGVVELLRRIDSDSGQIGVRFAPSRRLAPRDVLAQLVLADVQPAARPADGVVVYFPHPPAGTYVIEVRIPLGGAGRIDVTLDRQFGPAWSWDLSGARGAWRAEFHLPVSAAAVAIDVEPAHRSAIERMTLRSVELVGSSHRLADGVPDHVTRYGPALVFHMSGHAYMESAGTWIAGGESGDFVIEPDARQPIRLFVRNPPVENHVTLEGDGWRQDLAMKPGEERLVDVPLASGRAAARVRVTTARGARPVDFEKGSTDTRLLGCWIETR